MSTCRLVLGHAVPSYGKHCDNTRVQTISHLSCLSETDAACDLLILRANEVQDIYLNIEVSAK